MPVPARTLPEYMFDVVVLDPETASNGHNLVRASYFVEEGSYTLLKGRDHAAVAAFKTDLVVFIARTEAAGADRD